MYKTLHKKMITKEPGNGKTLKITRCHIPIFQ